MSSKQYNNDEKIIDGHEYDGIKELNNPLPNWWLWLFLVTIIFAFFYVTHYSLGGSGFTSDGLLQMQMAEIDAQKLKKKDELSTDEPIRIEEILSSPDKLEEGGKVFTQSCASCHGDKGQGGIGPNLVDAYWIHSKGEYKGIMNAINKGFPNKGMPPWETLIPANKRPLLAAFVLKLQGSNPPNPKAPQGDKVE